MQIKLNHDKDDLLEAFGISEKRSLEMSELMKEIILDTELNSRSKEIEKLVANANNLEEVVFIIYKFTFIQQKMEKELGGALKLLSLLSKITKETSAN